MSEREEFSKLSSVKKCLICGGKLVKDISMLPEEFTGALRSIN